MSVFTFEGQPYPTIWDVTEFMLTEPRGNRLMQFLSEYQSTLESNGYDFYDAMSFLASRCSEDGEIYLTRLANDYRNRSF